MKRRPCGKKVNESLHFARILKFWLSDCHHRFCEEDVGILKVVYFEVTLNIYYFLTSVVRSFSRFLRDTARHMSRPNEKK